MFINEWRSGAELFSLQTSGSTGPPKLITLTRAQLTASALATGHAFGLTPGDRALVCLNLSYIAGVMMLVRGEVLGLNLLIVPPAANPLATLDPATEHLDFAAFVPLQLQTILAGTHESVYTNCLNLLNSMKAILVGGAAVSPSLEAACQLLKAPVYSTYGMTETVSHVAIRRLNGPDRSDLFRVLPGVTVGTDYRGCLHITGAMTNYELVQTNDVVELVQPDEPTKPVQFKLYGRADSIINTGGVKIQPEVVEAIIGRSLAKLNINTRYLIAPMPDERLGQRVVLFLENSTITDQQWQHICAAVRAEAGPYAVPKAWYITGTFMETATAKLDRKRIVAEYLPEDGSGW